MTKRAPVPATLRRLAVATAVAGSILAVGAPAADSAIVPGCSAVVISPVSGSRITMAAGTCLTLRLDRGLRWSTPRSSSGAVKVLATPTAIPPAEWFLYAAHQGDATITSLGQPPCPPSQPVCPTYVVLYTLHVHVLAPPPGTD